MHKVVSTEQAIEISKKLRHTNKTLVLAGGCFDILHKGHTTFLQAAKAAGDILYILLESDTMIKKLKGESRPIHSQTDRASVLAALAYVDYIVLLPDIMTNDLYDKVISDIKPAIIATTKGDPNIHHKNRQAALVGGSVLEVIERLPSHSTTNLLTKVSV